MTHIVWIPKVYKLSNPVLAPRGLNSHIHNFRISRPASTDGGGVCFIVMDVLGKRPKL